MINSPSFNFNRSEHYDSVRPHNPEPELVEAIWPLEPEIVKIIEQQKQVLVDFVTKYWDLPGESLYVNWPLCRRADKKASTIFIVTHCAGKKIVLSATIVVGRLEDIAYIEE